MIATDAGYGGFWRRLAAYTLVDLPIEVLIGGIVGLFIGCVLGVVAAFVGAEESETVRIGEAVAAGAGFLVGWLYSAILESSPWQATFGKRLFGMQVVDLSGNRVTFMRATGRFAAKLLSGLFFGLGFIMIGRNDRKQGLHDDLAGTLVLRVATIKGAG